MALDDNPDALVALRRVLLTADFDVEIHTSPFTALDALRSHGDTFDLVITDVSMPEMNGLEFVGHAKEIHPSVPVIVLTGDNTAETAVRAMKSGAYNYIVKSNLARTESFLIDVRRAAAYGQLQRRAQQLEQHVTLAQRFEKLVGGSRAMETVFNIIEQVAELDVSVLVLGESGTGKELVARAIHNRSKRASGPFVAINCAALPDGLVDSELFGHAKGAFTGANQARAGAFARADGGTLFLDEIGDISAAAQQRLLRVLQEREVLPVGGERTRAVDVRVIAATLVDLEQAVEEKTFRADLYYRLNVVSLDLPPLRNRAEDVPLLAAHLIAKHASKLGRDAPNLAPQVMEALCAYSWPGNVRELENALLRAMALNQSDVIELEAFGERIQDALGSRPTPAPFPRPNMGGSFDFVDGLTLTEARKAVQERFERDYVTKLLRRTNGNISAAAREAGADRSNLRRIITRHGIKPTDYS